jgi:magnesium-transporting ATPase (P-type)
MSNFDRMYRIQKRLMIGIFICSIIAFCLVLFPSIHDSFRDSFQNPVDYSQFVRQSSKWKIIDTAERIALLLVFLLFSARVLVVRKSIVHGSTWNDERARMNRLRAFRPAFLVVLCIQIIILCLMFIFGPKYYLIGGSSITITGGIMILAGLALYYDRETRDE